MNSLKSQGTKAFIWDFSGKIARQGMAFIVSIFLARLLEPSDFGLIAIIMVIIGIAAVFTDIGLSGAIIQRRRVHPVHYSSVFYFNISIGMILTLTTYFSAPWISEFYNNKELLPLTQVMSLSFVLNALGNVQTTKLHKELNYALPTKIQLISSLLSGIIGVSLAFSGAGVWSLVVQNILSSISYNILIWTKSQWTPNLTFSWKALMQLWAYGFRMFLSGMLEAVFTRLDFLIIGKLLPTTTLGYFERAKSLNALVIQYSSGSLMSVLFPVLSKIQNDLPRFQQIILKSLGIISFITFLLLGGLYLVSEELIILLFSEKWLPSIEYFKILALSGFAYPVSSLLVNILISRGNSKAFLRLQIYKKMIDSLNFIVLYNWGIKAYLYGLIFTSVLAVLLNIYFAAREIKLPFVLFIKPIITQMIISIIAVLLTITLFNDLTYTYIIMFIIKGSFFTLLYFLFSYIVKSSSLYYLLEEIMPIVRKKPKKGS